MFVFLRLFSPFSTIHTKSGCGSPTSVVTAISALTTTAPLPGWRQHSHAHSTQAWSPTEDGGAEQEDDPAAVGMAVPGSQWVWHSFVSRKVRGQGQRPPQPLGGLQGLCRPPVLTSCGKQISWEGRLCDAQAPASFPAC